MVATFFLFFNPICGIFRVFIKLGVLAQLVERLNGIEKVRGSNPLGSRLRPSLRSGGYVWHAKRRALAKI